MKTTKCGLKMVDPSEYPDTWDENFVLKLIERGTIFSHTDYITKIQKALPDFILLSGHEVDCIDHSDVIFGYGEVPKFTSIAYWVDKPNTPEGCFIDWCETIIEGEWDSQADITIHNVPCIPRHLASQPILKGTPAYDAIIYTLLMESL